MSEEERERLEEIRRRLESARPKYPFMTTIMGSGKNLCTAIAAESQENDHMDFFADIFPDYVQNNLGDGPGKWADIGLDGHHARLQFLENVFGDMDFLLSLVSRRDGDV